METNQPKVIVRDLPSTLTATELEDALNPKGYYITRIMSLPEELGLRVIFTKRVKPEGGR